MPANFSVSRVFFGATLLGGGALAQPAPAPSSAAAHIHVPVTLDQMVVTATPFQHNQIDLAQSTLVLSGRSLLLKQQATLGETLSHETGIHATSYGPGSSRPIVRGLGGDRLRLLENGLASLDASATGPDHAVGIEPFLVARIEAVRGPASLLYGSAAVGGVVNVITHRIDTELPEERVRGEAELRFGSGAEEWARGGVVDLALRSTPAHALVLHLDGFRRSAGDLRIPGFAESARVRAAEAAEARAHDAVPEPGAAGELPNSSLDAESGAIGLSWVGRDFHVGASRNAFDSEYGVPGHAHEHAHAHEQGAEEDEAAGAGVRIQLRQRRTEAEGEWRAGAPGFIQGARVKFGQVDYRHTEIEPSGAVGTVFRNRGYDARTDLLHGGAPGWSGAFGLQATRSRLAAAGAEAFLPPSHTRALAAFAFEEFSRGALTWQLGARIERTHLSALGQRDRREHEFSGSLGNVWKIDEAWSVAVSLSRTGRPPTAQELFAHGPHAGTQAYEVGDAGLGTERSLGLEASLRRRSGAVTGALTLFTNRFSGYIFEQPTGRIAVEHAGAWEFLPPDDPEVAAHGGGLPVYRYVQRTARFWGVELEGLWHLHERPGKQFDLRFTADLTRAQEGERHLPRIPAARAGVGLLWAVADWSAGVDWQMTLAQRRVATNETTSDGYALLSVHVCRGFTVGRFRTEGFLRGTNLTDEEARPHTSFLKELAPLPGRALTAGLRLAF